ncbi:hypothetical protein A4S05_04815 [Nostoc sp. KVJ20]|nr:hypothetical protein A4S05_04815 [Nostoc sp. KVJ20]
MSRLELIILMKKSIFLANILHTTFIISFLKSLRVIQASIIYSVINSTLVYVSVISVGTASRREAA